LADAERALNYISGALTRVYTLLDSWSIF